ncbi:tyrosine-type recombinase/integrase [Streptomyces coeruleorubidus]|uniref:tyrosine-type recombinase/integrase n=1 Tax=Streptomyces coeruleorubidus TaxID=116188 RepID=UPI0033C2D63D
MPSGDCYWTVLDQQMQVMPAADGFLRYVRFSKDRAESTTEAYARAIVLFLRWCALLGLDWRSAAGHLGAFMLWLRHAPASATAGWVSPGPGAKPVRGPRRINRILIAVRGLLVFAAGTGDVPSSVVSQIYEIADTRDLPPEAAGSDSGLNYRLRARHRVKEPQSNVDRASDEEAVAMLRACCSARDLFLIIVMARAGLRRSQTVGLHREDLHFLVDSSALGCDFPGPHLHVVRRRNINGAWSKSRDSHIVPVDRLVVQAHDQYVFERRALLGDDLSDFVFVNLFREPIGSPMRPDAINDLTTALSKRAGLSRVIKPHMLRHCFGSNVADAGCELDVIQALLGQRSPYSAKPYLHPSRQRLRDAVERVGSPRLTTGATR